MIQQESLRHFLKASGRPFTPYATNITCFFEPCPPYSQNLSFFGILPSFLCFLDPFPASSDFILLSCLIRYYDSCHGVRCFDIAERELEDVEVESSSSD